MAIKIDKKILRLTQCQENVEQRLVRIQSLRLILAGLCCIILFYIALFSGNYLTLGLLFLGTMAFIFLVGVHRKIQNHYDELEFLKKHFQRLARRIAGLPPKPSPPQIPQDQENSDLDLLGPHSLFTQINETFTRGGEKLLIDWMLRPDPKKEKILHRQVEVALLARISGYLRHLVILGHKNTVDYSTESLLNFLANSLLLDGFTKRYLILKILFGINISGLILNFTEILAYPVAAGIFLYFMISLYLLNHVSHLFGTTQNISVILDSLMPVIGHLEKLAKNKDYIIFLDRLAQKPLSRELKKLNSICAYLSVQTHPIVYLMLNGLMPWTFFWSQRAENSRSQLTHIFPAILSQLHHLEALMSLTFVFKYQSNQFPRFSHSPSVSFKNLVHPLIPKDQVVPNDFHFTGPQKLALITGSNMAGKSTFLRTIGINQTLALMGSPIFGSEFQTFCGPVNCCIRISDSLDEGFSYFYSEVLRLSLILREARGGSPTLYLIDEIFKGTNNRERLIGAKALILELIKTESLGFITTHDLDLPHIEKECNLVGNWHFRDDIDQDKMVFFYKLQSGPCPTTNALHIMKQHGLPIGPTTPTEK